MEVIHSNPCAGCTIGQDCCNRLSRLRLTQIEFDRCFQEHAAELLVEREGPLFVVSQRSGGACPNWQNGSCTTYENRPRECALFPHTLYAKHATNNVVQVRVHSDTRCPLKTQLLSSPQAAEQLASEFATEAYGVDANICVAHESRVERLRRRASSLIRAAFKMLLNIAS